MEILSFNNWGKEQLFSVRMKHTKIFLKDLSAVETKKKKSSGLGFLGLDLGLGFI